MNNTYYKQVVGIPQGSVISTLICRLVQNLIYIINKFIK